MIDNTKTPDKKQSAFKQAYSCLDMDKMDTAQYTFNLNPELQPDWNQDICEHYVPIKAWYRKIIGSVQLMKYCNIIMYLEISPTGRYHFHGIIKIKNVLNFFVHDLYRLKQIGTYEIDTIKDLEVWTKYCSKQDYLIKDIFRGMVYNNPVSIIQKEPSEP